ncbi:VOC family protein [Caballeronia telluris]|uniref:Glyoxalase n=1 Tax=Caballeronia telluris TaxID=326475 RepID=A0A158FG20_9BURK|nr:glyoxalase [Caballeronia telluris]
MTVHTPAPAFQRTLKLDHLVVAARTLEEGERFIAGKFGVGTAGGGAHPLMRTHNRLLNLWGGAYLEVIAIVPDAPAAEAPRARLFALDSPAMQARIESGPQLVHWAVRVDRPRLLARWQAQYPERIAPVVPMSRGASTWSLTVPDDGAFPAWQGAGDGVVPSLIQWDTTQHPSAALPETGIALRSLTGHHPRAEAIAEHLAWLGAAHLMRIEPTSGAPGIVAEFELPDGSIVTLGESAESAEAAQSREAARRAVAEADEAKKSRRRAKSKKPDDEREAHAPDEAPGTAQDPAHALSRQPE